MDLTEIEGYLTTLGLPTDKLPTLTEYKLAYREKLKLHPDKIHENVDKTKDHDVICEILEAALHNMFSSSLLSIKTTSQEKRSRIRSY